MVKINETQCNGIDKLGIPAKWNENLLNCALDLSGSNLAASDLIESDMQVSNLTGIDLRFSKLINSDLSRSKLDGAKISKSQKDKINWVEDKVEDRIWKW